MKRKTSHRLSLVDIRELKKLQLRTVDEIYRKQAVEINHNPEIQLMSNRNSKRLVEMIISLRVDQLCVMVVTKWLEISPI